MLIKNIYGVGYVSPTVRAWKAHGHTHRHTDEPAYFICTSRKPRFASVIATRFARSRWRPCFASLSARLARFFLSSLSSPSLWGSPHFMIQRCLKRGSWYSVWSNVLFWFFILPLNKLLHAYNPPWRSKFWKNKKCQKVVQVDQGG